MSRMLALVCLAGAVLSPLFTLQVAAQAANPADALHEACYVDAAGTTFRIYVDGAGTTYTRTANGTAQSFAYEVLAMPAAGAAWEQGKAFGNKAQKKDVFPVDDDKVKSATWTRDASTRVDTFTFVTKHEVEVVFTSTRCAGWNNCPFRGGYPKHCWSELETCCGYNTLGATCMPKDGSYQCCSHYLSARACNSTQTCCGMSGPGASSYAFCCDAGSTCCQASTSYNGAASCCPSGTTCCRGYSFGLCCGAGETCDSFNNRCVSATPSTSPAPVPTPEPTPEPSSMPAPTTP